MSALAVGWKGTPDQRTALSFVETFLTPFDKLRKKALYTCAPNGLRCYFI